MIEQANKNMQSYLDKKLNKYGWQWNLVSTLTEGIIRVQIAPAGEGYEPRIKCFNGKTLKETADDAEKYIQNNKIHRGKDIDNEKV